ncbi:TetR/AcrR family transcriptional regulator [Humibacter ginsenosidimutans]|uniref:TetR/AcrR family transcriptional regulator n=1 Tax=Humibacter ginsenosidimutans TaxID=2599293 RepID=A0A5B8M0T0_9MICO|nr:helix-turn-helix domain-containing protein [Humibacter ginsenosidimutans]QDZ13534.1 TetR/AcrR family transcriptional regulator [Humibacter ginsenosidimutans]
MPTGVALQDPREQLFAAADRVMLRDGPGALTSRAVTEELGVAKGVLHRHFVDFDDFLVELVGAHLRGLSVIAHELERRVGTLTVVANTRFALTGAFDALGLAVVSLVIGRDEVRRRLRGTAAGGIPYLAEIVELLADYLEVEKRQGRLAATADPRTIAVTLTGTSHLLFAGELGGLPDESAVDEVVESVLVGALPGVGH